MEELDQVAIDLKNANEVEKNTSSFQKFQQETEACARVSAIMEEYDDPIDPVVRVCRKHKESDKPIIKSKKY